jgi:hypothetical protein
MQKKLTEISFFSEDTLRPHGRGALISKKYKKTDRNQFFIIYLKNMLVYSISLMNLSASNAAIQPVPADVIA